MAEENKRLGVVIDNSKDSDIDPELADEILRDDDNYVPRNSLGGGAADALLRANSSAPVAPNRIIGIAAMVCAVHFGLGKWIGSRHGDRVAGGQLLGQKNTAVGIWMANTYLNPLASVFLAFYSIWQNLFNSWQLWRHDRKESA